MARVLEPERDPCEKQKDGEEERKGMGLFEKKDKGGERIALGWDLEVLEWVLRVLGIGRVRSSPRVCHFFFSMILHVS